MPVISKISDAIALHTQLDAVNRAIIALGSESTVINMTISAPPLPPLGSREMPPGPTVFSPPITIVFEPPISDPDTIATLIQAFRVRANEITAQLVSQGYTDDQTAR
jgi:hypothetical protein